MCIRDRDYTRTVVGRSQKAGLVIFGKTASPEFGGTPCTESILFGDTRNPWNLKYTPGGSSGGSAAAVAAGVLPLANATDGGGSIRIPASCCGLFGMKPSRGRVPSGPIDLSSTMSVIHAVSRSVRDSAALLDASGGPEPGQTTIAPLSQGSYLEAVARTPRALRIGLISTPLTHSPVDPECSRAAVDAAKLCENLGHRVQEIQLPVDPREFFASTRIIMGTGTVMRVANREQQLGRKVTENDLEPIIWQRYQSSRAYTAEQLAQAEHGIVPSEQASLVRIARLIGVDTAQLESWLRMANAQQQFQQQSPQSTASIEDAYAALGVNSSASDKEVKHAWRKRLSENDPDKLIANGVPEAMTKVVTGRGQEIQAAYAMIKKTRPTMG